MKPLNKLSAQELDRLLSGDLPSGQFEVDDLRLLVEQIRSQNVAAINSDLQAGQLAKLMSVVNLTDKGDLAVRPASKVNGPARQASGLPKQRRRLVLESVFAMFAIKLALGGAAVAVAATGGLAATGNLPDSAQTAVAQVVDGIGIEIPLGETARNALEQAQKKSGEAAERAAERAASEAGPDVPAPIPGQQTPAVPNENSGFGQGVAAGAQAGEAGRSISEAAREQATERGAPEQGNRPVAPGPPGDTQQPAVPAPNPAAGGNLPAEAGPPAGPGSSSEAGPPGPGMAPVDPTPPGPVSPTGVGGGRP